MPATTSDVAAQQLRKCRACRQGHLHEAARERIFHPHGKQLVVQLATSVCDHCAAEAPTAVQHEANLRRLSDRKQHYDGLLMGEEIAGFRRRYGLTQQKASRIFGKGKIAFSRYENETTYPDTSTTLLLAMAIEKPDALKWLADRAGVELPLWRERCEDVRLSLRPVAVPVDKLKAVRQRFEFESAGTSHGREPWQSVGDQRRTATVDTHRMQVHPFRKAA